MYTAVPMLTVHIRHEQYYMHISTWKVYCAAHSIINKCTVYKLICSVVLCIHIQIASKVQGMGSWGIHQFITSCRTCNNSLTLRITVLPFSSIREDHTVHCTLQCTIQGWGMKGCVDVWGGVGCRSEGGVGWGEV